MGEEKKEEGPEEEREAVIEDVEWREDRWWYYVRYPDGTAEWVPEERLRLVASKES